MAQLDLVPTGGRWGTITRLREQMKKLSAASISCTYDGGNSWAMKNIQPVSQTHLWWDPKSPQQAALFGSTVTLGEEFFKEVRKLSAIQYLSILRHLKLLKDRQWRSTSIAGLLTV